MSMRQIAKDFGVPLSSLYDMFCENGITRTKKEAMKLNWNRGKRLPFLKDQYKRVTLFYNIDKCFNTLSTPICTVPFEFNSFSSSLVNHFHSVFS